MPKRNVRVLLIEDNPGDVRLIREWLSESDDAAFQVEAIPRLSMGLSRMDEDPLDLVLLDLQLPDSGPENSLRMTLSKAQDVPVVIFSAMENEDMAIEALKRGAQNFLQKGAVEGRELVKNLLLAVDRFDRYRGSQDTADDFDHLVGMEGDGIVVVDADGIVQFVNPAAEVLLDREADRLLHRPFPHAVPDGETRDVEVDNAVGDPTVVSLRGTGIAWQGEQAHLVVLRDVTETRRLSQALTDEASLLDAVLAVEGTLGGGVAIFDDFTGEIRMATPAFHHLLGTTAAKATNREDLVPLVRPEDQPVLEAWRDARRRGEGQSGPIPIRVTRDDGTERRLVFTTSPVEREGRRGTLVMVREDGAAGDA